jgi:predicted Zn-dependent protease with MMP-like domain
MMRKVLKLAGVSDEKISALADIGFDELKENLRDVINHNYGALKMGWKELLKKKIMAKLGIGLKSNLTDSEGFKLGQRGKRSRGNHPIYL